jgi:hypothetical protein
MAHNSPLLLVVYERQQVSTQLLIHTALQKGRWQAMSVMAAKTAARHSAFAGFLSCCTARPCCSAHLSQIALKICLQLLIQLLICLLTA